MPDWLPTTLQIIIGSGVGAGIVTFGLNFWKGERDIRRANLERLYKATHKYTARRSRDHKGAGRRIGVWDSLDMGAVIE